MNIEKNILSIADQYDTFFVDVYGVLYNGITLYDNALETLEELRKRGKKVIVVSNMTQVADDAKRSYEQRGMYEGTHYDKFVTSGEYLHYSLTSRIQEITKRLGMDIFSIKCLFMGNASVFADSQIVKTESFDYADLIYVGVPRASYGSVRIDNLLDENDNPVKIEDIIHCDWHKLHDSLGRKGPTEFAIVLEKCFDKKKILVVANPDIFAYESGNKPEQKIVPVFQQGILGRYYEKLGGKVAHFGKPYSGIFEFAKQFAGENDRIVMVGDTPWTDILGANNAGISSAMVMTGVAGEFLKGEKLPLEQKFDQLYGEISLRMSGLCGSTCPTHVLERFSATSYSDK